MTSEHLLLDFDEDLSLLTRPELQERCGRLDIKRNLKTEEMRLALDKIRHGEELDPAYYTKVSRKWAPTPLTVKKFVKRHYKEGGLTCGTFILVIITIIIIMNTIGDSSPVPSPPTNGTFSPGNGTDFPLMS